MVDVVTRIVFGVVVRVVLRVVEGVLVDDFTLL